mmetsp:Transcript_23766/g.34632  ORF Transcript_23766/g.34632 Transcript_23766/m.34632 type:complete len:408 (-) Transcript_23766:81-1304(-)
MFWGPQEKGQDQKMIHRNPESDDDDNRDVKHFGGNKRKRSELEIGMPDPKLHSLLDLNPEIEEERRKFDGQAVIEEIRQKPYAARALYAFEKSRHSCFPIQMAIMLGASTNVVDFLLSVYPRSIGARDMYGSTLLHSACEFQAPLEVVSLLLERFPGAITEKDFNNNTPLNSACRCEPTTQMISLLIQRNPDAIRERNKEGMTPLHSACSYQASVEVVSLLLEIWPAATMEKDNYGMTPLHNSCEFEAPFEVISLLMNKYPAACRENDRYGRTPLHSACWNNAPERVLKMLLEEYPRAVSKNDLLMGSLQDYYFENQEVEKLVSNIYRLTCDEISNHDAKEIMTHFINAEWWGGAALVVDSHPAVVNLVGVSDKCFPYLFSRVERRSKLLTTWQLLSNRQDLFANLI